MVSGYLSKKQPTGKFQKTESALIATLLIFELINSALGYLMGRTLIPLFQPYWTLWYLLSLVYWRLLVQFAPSRWIDHQYIVVIASVVLALTTPLIPIGYIASFQRTFTFLPFFMIGYYLRRESLMVKVRDICCWKAIIAIAICLLLCGAFVRLGLPVMQTLRGADTYWNCYLPLPYAMTLKAALLMASLCFCISLLSIFKVSTEKNGD